MPQKANRLVMLVVLARRLASAARRPSTFASAFRRRERASDQRALAAHLPASGGLQVARAFRSCRIAQGRLLGPATRANAAMLLQVVPSLWNRGALARPHAQAGALIEAVRAENWNEARRLVRGVGVPVDAQDRSTERTPLTEAAANGHLAGICFLIDELGADPQASCDCAKGHRHTALHYAAERGDAAAIALLLKRGANPKMVSEHGCTAEQLLPAQATAARLLLSPSTAQPEPVFVLPHTQTQDRPHFRTDKRTDKRK